MTYNVSFHSPNAPLGDGAIAYGASSSPRLRGEVGRALFLKKRASRWGDDREREHRYLTWFHPPIPLRFAPGTSPRKRGEEISDSPACNENEKSFVTYTITLPHLETT